MKKFLLVVILSSLFIPMMKNSPTAKACGGAPSRTIEEFITEADVVVKATPISSDYLGQNGILLVEQYFKGSGGQFILFSHLDPIIVQDSINGEQSFGSCTWVHSSLELYQPAYFFLYQLSDGSYFNLLDEGVAEDYPWISFPDENATVQIFRTENYEQIDISEPELVELMTELSGHATQPPDMDIPYPLYAPLKVTTSTNQVYLLPIDGQPPIEVTTEMENEIRSVRPYYQDWLGLCEDCPYFSPDWQMYAIQTAPDTIFISYLGEVQTEHVLFSPNIKAVAIWKDGAIEVYQVVRESPNLSSSRSRFSNRINLEGTITSYDAAWSPDGRFLAYSDEAGLWLWDVYTKDSAPRLLIAAEDNIPYARYFSPLGRYLAFSNGDIRGNLDTVSGEVLPDGLISPDDRTLLSFDAAQETSPLGVCGLTTGKCSERFYYFEEEETFKQIQWRNTNEFFALICAEECRIMTFEASEDWYIQATSTQLNALQYTYDSSNDALAVLIDETSIAINPLYPFWSTSSMSSPMRIDYDLSSYIEGEIVDIEWLPSLFYNPPR